jgi:Amt family ammonium transporter
MFLVKTILSALVFSALLGTSAHAQTADFASLKAQLDAMELNLVYFWTLVAVMVVFLMKGGYMLFEAGLVRSKNTINTAQKNLSDTLISTIIFYMFGYNIMFAETQGGWIGWHLGIDFRDIEHTFFLYQVVFCSLVATVVSGAVAERIKFTAYMMGTIFITAIVYPVFGHWAWGDKILPDNTSFLIEDGFIDFAGGTVVAGLGGWVALAAILVIGPRVGRYNEDGSINPMPASNVVLAGFGTMIIWVGALAFNSGLANTGSEDIAHIMSNTLLAGALSGATSLVIGRLLDGLYRPERCIYGVLGGLAAIAAGVHVFSLYDTLIVSVLAGIMVAMSFRVLTHLLKVDDVVCAVPINGFCGSLGTLMVGPLGYVAKFGGNDRVDQFFAQFEGVVTSFIWAFGATYLFFTLLKHTHGVRVDEEEELMGLNSAEHGVTMGTGILQEKFRDIVEGEGDLTTRLDETTGDESAEIAILFNKFVQRVQSLLLKIEQNSKIITSSSERLTEVSDKFAEGFDNIAVQSEKVSGSSSEISKELGEVTRVIEEVSQNVSVISGNADSVSSNIQSVSHDVSQMTQSINGIAQNTSQASQVAEKANTMIEKASGAMKVLSDTATSIDSILQMISDITEQTNLLALNANIEASKAGEAGKGFAVVATEVKSLANQTTKAAEDIHDKINQIQGETSDVSGMIGDLKGIIGKINMSLGEISDAANSQSEMASQITGNITDTSSNARTIADEISAISQGAENAASNLSNAASESGEVQNTIDQFTQEAEGNSENAGNVKTSVNDLSSVAQELTKIVNEYKLR